jgi:hypothetical protein
LLLLYVSTASAQNAIEGGGRTSNDGPMIGSNYSVSGTNRRYSVTDGFWALPTAVQSDGAPTLMIIPAKPVNAMIFWTPATPELCCRKH